jgi:protein required for attachment to host cells
MHHINKGTYLNSNYTEQLKEDLENEAPMRGHRSILNQKSGTKASIWKGGTSFAAYSEDITFAAIYHNSKDALYLNATDKMHIRTKPNSTLSNAINASGEIFHLVNKYLFGQNSEYSKIIQLQ